MNDVKDITSLPNNKTKSALFFWASWHDASKLGGQMDLVFRSLASASNTTSDANASKVEFFRVEAEAVPEISVELGVTIVPTCVLLDENGKVVTRVEGVEPALLTQAISSLRSMNGSSVQSTDIKSSPTYTPEKETLNDRLAKLIRASEVMLFMKGTPLKPRCGFSRQTVTILENANIGFSSFDILEDEEVRQGLKTFSDWPTYPQLYVHGELIGGLDVLKEMLEECEQDQTSLAEHLDVKEEKKDVEAPIITLEQKIKALVNRSRIMLFMKGVPSKPKCGFSRQIVEILEEENVAYDSFSILEDEEVRQGLKKMYDWPTYPQLYVGGELIGGLDVVKELKDDDELSELLKG